MQSGKRRPCCFNLAACTDPNLSKNGKLMSRRDVVGSVVEVDLPNATELAWSRRYRPLPYQAIIDTRPRHRIAVQSVSMQRI